MLGTEREGLAIKGLGATDEGFTDRRKRMRRVVPGIFSLPEHGPPLHLRPLHRESPGRARKRALRVQAAGASANKGCGSF